LLHLITGLNRGGTEVFLERLLLGLDRRKFTSTVVSLTTIGPIGERLRAHGISVEALGMRRGFPSPTGLAKLMRLLRRQAPHVLQTWLYHADLLGAFASPFARGTRLVWNVRASNMDMQRYRPLSGWTVRACAWLSPWPHAVVVNSRAGRDFHVQLGYRPRQWVLIPNGVDGQEFRPRPEARAEMRRELGLTPDAILIGLVARFDPMKDHDNFLRAAGSLAHQRPDVHFVCVGEGVTAENAMLRIGIEDAQLSGRVHLLGPCADVPGLTAAFDIAALASLSEGFPNVVAEAMACGVPCVVTDVGDAASIVGDTGIVVPPEDPTALAEGWSQLLALSATERNRLGQRARDRIEREFSLAHTVTQYEAFYSSLAE
jgi:glycosyltransferase involved in cell wall biosynthesis